MVNYKELIEQLAEYQNGRLSGLELAEWSLRKADELPEMLDCPLLLAALSFYLDEIWKSGPSFVYTYDRVAFDKLIGQIADTLAKKHVWRESANYVVAGKDLLEAVPETVACVLREKVGLTSAGEGEMYNLQYDMRISGEDLTIEQAKIANSRQ